MKRLLIYGANGYTGRLICAIAKERGLFPILAGRNQIAIAELAQTFGWDYRVFGIESKEEIMANLAGIDVVMHAAGPFRFTAKNMLEACLEEGVHYLDITGEIEVFSLAHSMDKKALHKNIMLMPGTGFDVVPTDCLAYHLKQQMPDASSLELAFVTLGGQISHGTAMSMSEKLGEGGACRTNGKIVKEPIGKKGKYITPGGKKFFVMSIPWGDVFTSFHTTGIGNMHAYTGISPTVYRVMKLQFLFNPLLRTRWFRQWMQQKINQRPAGPSSEKRMKAKSYIWGEVTNAAGMSKSAWFSTPEGYTLTALTAVDIAQRVLHGDWKPGYQTPAGCYGFDLITPYIKEWGNLNA